MVNQSCDAPVGYPIFVAPVSVSSNELWRDLYASDGTGGGDGAAKRQKPRGFGAANKSDTNNNNNNKNSVQMQQLKDGKAVRQLEANTDETRPVRTLIDNWLL